MARLCMRNMDSLPVGSVSRDIMDGWSGLKYGWAVVKVFSWVMKWKVWYTWLRVLDFSVGHLLQSRRIGAR